MRLKPEVGIQAIDALREFGSWAREAYIRDLQFSPQEEAPPLGGSIDLERLRDELLSEHPQGFDWTGISNAMLFHSPDQVVYTDLDDHANTKLVRHLLPPSDWPTSLLKPGRSNGGDVQIPMDLGMRELNGWTSHVLWWEDIAWPQFVGPEAMTKLRAITDHWDAPQVWVSIADAERRARPRFDARLAPRVRHLRKTENLPAERN